MRDIFIYFTNGDAEPALESGVPNTLEIGGGSRVLIACEQSNPVSDDCMKRIRNKTRLGAIAREVTSFRRNDSRNYWPAIIGILETVVKVCEANNLVGAFKIDADTFIRSTRWADLDSPLCGWCSGRLITAHRMCYWISKEAAQQALASIKTRSVVDSRVAEARVITSEILYLSSQRQLPPPKILDRKTGEFGVWDWSLPAIQPKDASVIHFGGRPKKGWKEIAEAMGQLGVKDVH